MSWLGPACTSFIRWTATHPPIDDRIKELEKFTPHEDTAWETLNLVEQRGSAVAFEMGVLTLRQATPQLGKNRQPVWWLRWLPRLTTTRWIICLHSCLVFFSSVLLVFTLGWTWEASAPTQAPSSYPQPCRSDPCTWPDCVAYVCALCESNKLALVARRTVLSPQKLTTKPNYRYLPGWWRHSRKWWRAQKQEHQEFAAALPWFPLFFVLSLPYFDKVMDLHAHFHAKLVRRASTSDIKLQQLQQSCMTLRSDRMATTIAGPSCTLYLGDPEALRNFGILGVALPAPVSS